MTVSSEEWREAGLAEPDELEPANPLLASGEAEPGEDHQPPAARPDLEGEADEADVAEQAYELTEDDGPEPPA